VVEPIQRLEDLLQMIGQVGLNFSQALENNALMTLTELTKLVGMFNFAAKRSKKVDHKVNAVHAPHVEVIIPIKVAQSR